MKSSLAICAFLYSSAFAAPIDGLRECQALYNRIEELKNKAGEEYGRVVPPLEKAAREAESEKNLHEMIMDMYPSDVQLGKMNAAAREYNAALRRMRSTQDEINARHEPVIEKATHAFVNRCENVKYTRLDFETVCAAVTDKFCTDFKSTK